MHVPEPTLHRHLGPALADIVRAGERLAFWLAVLLPFVHVPLLVLWGVTPETAPALAALWGLHGVALLAGRRHRTGALDGADESRPTDARDGRSDPPTEPTPDC